MRLPVNNYKLFVMNHHPYLHGAIQGDTATISTALGDLNGTIIEIQDDIATIETGACALAK